jgi:hypothetical protein
MASLPDTHVILISFPRPLPMDEDVDIVFFDDDPFKLELEGDSGKGFEVQFDLPLQVIQLIQRQQHGTERGPIPSLIGAPQGFQRLIDTEESLVLCWVSDGLRRTPNDHHSEHDEPHDG